MPRDRATKEKRAAAKAAKDAEMGGAEARMMATLSAPLLFFAPQSDLLTDPLVAQANARAPGVLAQLVPSLGTCRVQNTRWSSLKDVPYYHFSLRRIGPPRTAPDRRARARSAA